MIKNYTITFLLASYALFSYSTAFGACSTNTSTTGSTDLSAYNEGYALGAANPGKELYTFSEEQNVCAKYAKECTKFNACKEGYSAGSSGQAANPPTST